MTSVGRCSCSSPWWWRRPRWSSAWPFGSGVLVWLKLMSFDEREREVVLKGVEWIKAGGFSVRFGLLVDPLSITMVLFVTGVGALIHLYSIGYMHGQERFTRFFTYLNM